MERDVLESIPKIQDLLEALKTAGVADLVWGVMGGNPASYHELKADWLLAGRKDVVEVAESFVTDELRMATDTLNAAKALNRSLIGPVYGQFKILDELPASIREKHVLPTPDKVLRLVAKKGQPMGHLVPTTPAMALVLRYGEGGDPPSLDVVREALGMK
jgi:hypothetical protein